jgi:hypothetical protein
VELVEALAMNRSLTIENRYVIMHNFVTPLIFQGWRKHFTKNIKLTFKLIIAVFELNYYHSPILYKAALTLLNNPKFNNLNKVDLVLKILQKVEKDELGDMEFTTVIQGYKDKLVNNESYHWRYNVEEERFYTYAEMKAKRENVDVNSLRHVYEGIKPDDENDKRVWHEHWVHLVMKRDITKYMKKMKDLDDQKRPYEIDFDNFNPRKWMENIKLLGKDDYHDMEFFEEEDEDSVTHFEISDSEDVES